MGEEDPSVTPEGSGHDDFGPATGAWEPGAYGDDYPPEGPGHWEGASVEGPGLAESWRRDGTAGEQPGWSGEGTWETGQGAWQQEDEPWHGAPGSWYGDRYYREASAPGYAGNRTQALSSYQDPYSSGVATRTWHEAPPPAPAPRRQTRGSGPWPELVMVAAVAVIAAAVILAVTSANSGRNSPQGLTGTPTSAVGGPRSSGAGSPTSSASSASSTSVTTARRRTSTTRPAGKSVRNLVVSAGVKASLVKSWLATNPGGVGLVAKDVSGTVPGSVYYGEQKANPPIYWALAAFQPSAALTAEKSTAAGQTALAQFQNSDYVFSWKSGPYWTELGYVSNGQCPGSYVPTPVLKVWGLCGL